MVRITVHVKDGCHWCEQWRADEQPFLDPNWEVDIVEGGASSFPTIHINVDGKTQKLVGYRTVSQISNAIEDLKDG